MDGRKRSRSRERGDDRRDDRRDDWTRDEEGSGGGGHRGHPPPPPQGAYGAGGWGETMRAPPRSTKLVQDEFGRMVPEDEHLRNLAREERRRREREAAKREGPPRTLKPWEMPDPEELAAAAAAKANEEPVDPEDAAMAAMLGFSSFASTKGKPVEENTQSAAKGAIKKVTVKKYRQYMNTKEGQRGRLKNSSAV